LRGWGGGVWRTDSGYGNVIDDGRRVSLTLSLIAVLMWAQDRGAGGLVLCLLIPSIIDLGGKRMATEIFSCGYTAWRTQRPNGYEVSGYLDGREFDVITESPERAERAFRRAARRAWLRRKLRTLRGLPARELAPLSSADTYHDVSLGLIFRALLSGIAKRMRR
jgi:hypothetical protein